MANLPKIAMQRLHQNSAAGVHPDPNLISAFVEGSLSPAARGQILKHMAQCRDCREVVFLSTPDQAATMPAVATPSNWLTWPALRWGAALATVVVVVAAVGLHRQSGRASRTSSAIQQTDAPSAKENTPAALPEEKHDVAAMPKPAAVSPVLTNRVADAEVRRLDQLKKQSSRVTALPMLAEKSEAAAAKLSDQPRDELDTGTNAEVAGQAQAPVESVAAGAAAQAVPGRAKDANEPAAPSLNGGMGGGVGNGAAAFKSRPAMFSEIAAPRWTLTSDGTLQRSLDFGRSWQTIQVASQATFRALAANGRDIWVGGSKGALYHSTDAGQHWTQVQPVSSGQALGDDIIGVEFPDPQHGKLTTASKGTWTTDDGGQSWRQK